MLAPSVLYMQPYIVVIFLDISVINPIDIHTCYTVNNSSLLLTISLSITILSVLYISV